MISNNWDEIVKQYPVTMEVNVQWGDMDAAKHVNNGIYLKWCETARIGYFNAMGMDTTFSGAEAGPILGYQDCKYIFPITFPDIARIACKVIEIEADRFSMECLIFSKSNDRLAVISKQKILAYSYRDLKKMPLPDDWVNAIHRLQINT